MWWASLQYTILPRAMCFSCCSLSCAYCTFQLHVDASCCCCCCLTFVTVCVLHFSCRRALLLSVGSVGLCVYKSILGKYFNSTQLQKSVVQKVFFFCAIKQLDFLFHRKCYRFRNESRIVLFACQYIALLYCSSFFLSSTHKHTRCQKVCSFSCKWICFHHGELEEPSELASFFWRVCVHGLHEFYWKMCIFFGHALIWHDITKRRQPATMATITIKHERQRDNENSPATKYIYNVLMPV